MNIRTLYNHSGITIVYTWFKEQLLINRTINSDAEAQALGVYKDATKHSALGKFNCFGGTFKLMNRLLNCGIEISSSKSGSIVCKIKIIISSY